MALDIRPSSIRLKADSRLRERCRYHRLQTGHRRCKTRPWIVARIRCALSAHTLADPSHQRPTLQSSLRKSPRLTRSLLSLTARQSANYVRHRERTLRDLISVVILHARAAEVKRRA